MDQQNVIDSGLKKFEYTFDWRDSKVWFLPQKEGMYQNLFAFLDEWITRVMFHVRKKETEDQFSICVQAGGAMGLWPIRLSDFFDQIYSFEPVRINRECFEMNADGKNNITILPYALGDRFDWVEMTYSKKELNSYGAHHVSVKKQPEKDAFQTLVPDTRMISLDQLKLDQDPDFYDISLIQLDVEGYELPVLKGAVKTIEKHLPTIVIEERQLPWMNKMGTRAGEARQFLEMLGYQVVDKLYGDVVMKVV